MMRATARLSTNRVRFIAVLAGAASALAIATVAAPANARLPWSDMATCTNASPSMRADRVERAIRACSAVLDSSQSRVAHTRRALITRAELYAARGNYGQAVDDYRRAVDHDPSDPVAYLGLGRMQARVNDLDGALASFDAAYERDAGDVATDARIAAGDVYSERRQWREAIAAYSEADRPSASTDRRVRLLLGRGHAKAGGGDLNGAMEDFLAALLEDRNSIEARLALADGHRLMAFPPGSPADWAHYNAALDHYDDAVERLEARRGDSHRQLTASVLTGRGELFLRRYLADAGDRSILNLAARDFDAAVSLDSNNVRALSGRAAAFAQNPAERDRAVADLDRALRIAPDAAELYRARANLHAEAGDSERAVRDYDQTIRRGGENSYAAYYRRGLIYLDEGDLARADQSFTRAAALAASGEVGPGVDPMTARAEALVMRSRTAWGRLDEPGADARAIARRARDDADTAAALAPNRADFVSASCLARTVAGGEWETAELACDRAIRLASGAQQVSDAHGAAGLLNLRRALAGGSNVQEVVRLQFAEHNLRDAINANPNAPARTALYRYALGVTLECLNRRLEADRLTAAALDADRGVAARFEAHRIRRCR